MTRKIDTTLTQKLTNRIDEIYPDVVEWRRYLHRNPELSYQEFETTKWISEKLEGWGFEVLHPCETGCVAVLTGGMPNERVVALRADIDALSIEEEGEAKQAFLSKNAGVAHCCGHDTHTSNMLGTALLLSELREHIRGTVVLIFQAAEENLPGGGRLLTETGILEKLNVGQIYGLHTYPQLEPGKLAVREGAMMASTSEFRIEILGKGGHAAAPHLAVDPIVIAAQVVQQLQTIVSRNIDPAEPAVVTVGKISGGSACNIIPEKVTLDGTIRTFDEQLTHRIFERMTTLSTQTARGSGGNARTELFTGYPPVINHPETTRNLLETAGESVEIMENPVMAGEDFAFYQKHIPGTFFFLGSGSDEADSRYSWHHPKYNVDERCLKTGIKIMVTLALEVNSAEV